MASDGDATGGVMSGGEAAPAARLTMYSTPWCGYCHRLKGQLQRAGVDFQEVDIEQDQAAAQFVASVNGGNQTVPTVLLPDGSSLTNPTIREVLSHL